MEGAGYDTGPMMSSRPVRAGLAGLKELVGVFTKGFADGPVDGGRIFLEHIFRGLEQTDGGKDW